MHRLVSRETRLPPWASKEESVDGHIARLSSEGSRFWRHRFLCLVARVQGSAQNCQQNCQWLIRRVFEWQAQVQSLYRPLGGHEQINQTDRHHMPRIAPQSVSMGTMEGCFFEPREWASPHFPGFADVVQPQHPRAGRTGSELRPFSLSADTTAGATSRPVSRETETSFAVGSLPRCNCRANLLARKAHRVTKPIPRIKKSGHRLRAVATRKTKKISEPRTERPRIPSRRTA